MKKTIIKFWDKAIILLLFIFGIFASCDKPRPKYGMPVPPDNRDTNVCIPEYGVPQTHFNP
jgi:hypothetical protein